jgi:hypothetical protein
MFKRMGLFIRFFYFHASIHDMLKQLAAVLFLVQIVFTGLAQTTAKSPEQFLGYKLGDRYSPHFKVVNYYKHVAESTPSMVKLEQYGETNEGRPLLLAYISSPENLSQLDAVRTNNLRLAGMTKDKMAPNENAPVIVWMSYNVHGNETSSSEAAMLTLYELINPSNAKSKEWLKNTVVIIDPCMNPDGRDRYVNWFNSVVGKNADPHAFSREHNEPWPGGRMNHYYFDLNRDWAWQTQKETQQRMLKYNQWLPHVHVDFHEQGFDDPYYFAPAAEPFHEVITDWQREFQTIIGKNNAKYFDQNGWLYFTKERFDLFYPSYGDTYPTYKGAIGMTYEQGGHSRAGISVINEDDDTLTLLDRLTHHFTTGMSTIEISSLNASKVVREFKKYYDKARSTPAGDFKAYVIKADNGDRLDRLIRVLDANHIDWSYTKAGNANGVNYLTGKSEGFKTSDRDIVINANQPNSNMIKVLFERSSQLSDSVTYDITAWSIPFAYGLSTYGLSNYFTNTTKNKPVAETVSNNVTNAYAYAVSWNGLNSARFLSELLTKGIKVRYAEQAFSIKGQNFGKGTLLITRTSNAAYNNNLEAIVKQAAQNAKISYTAVETGFVDKGFDIGSDRVRMIKAPKVGLLAGDRISPLGMGEIWHLFDAEIKYPVHVIWGNQLNRSVLSELDVLIFPDGNYNYFGDKNMNETLKDWVSSGGKIIALENTAVQMSRADWGFKLKGDDEKKDDKKNEKKDDYSLIRRYENRERDFIPYYNPGSIFEVQLDDSHPLAYGYNELYHTLKMDDNVYEFIRESGWNVGVIKKNNYVTGFTGSAAKEKLKDGVLFGVKDIGRGEVVILADNPVFRSFWENGKLLFCNAVFMVGQ